MKTNYAVSAKNEPSTPIEWASYRLIISKEFIIELYS